MPSTSNRTGVGLVKETTFGTTPATPAIRAQRVTSAQFQFAIKTEISKELRPDRQIPDAIRVGSEPKATLNIESSHAGLNDMIEGTMFSALTVRWPLYCNPATSQEGQLGTITSLAFATPDVTATVTGGTAAVGDIYAVSGCLNQNNNGIFVAIAGTSGSTIVWVNALGAAETPPAGARIKLCGYQGTAAAIAAVAGGFTGLPTAAALVAGDWFKIGGTATTSTFATAADNGWFRALTAATAGAVSIDNVPAGFAADAGTGQTIQIFVGEYARPGLTLFSYTYEERFEDLVTPEYWYYAGMVASKLTLNAKAQALLTGSIEYMGLTSVGTTTRVSGATDIAATDFPIMTGSIAAGRVFINGAIPAGLNFVTATEITIDNTLRVQVALGSDSPIGIGVGRTDVKGKLSFYYSSDVVLNNLRNNVPVGLMVLATGGDDTYGRQGLMVDMPRIKFLDGDVTVPGVDTDRMWEPTFQATLDVSYGYNVQMEVFEGFLGA